MQSEETDICVSLFVAVMKNPSLLSAYSLQVNQHNVSFSDYYYIFKLIPSCRANRASSHLAVGALSSSKVLDHFGPFFVKVAWWKKLLV